MTFLSFAHFSWIFWCSVRFCMQTHGYIDSAALFIVIFFSTIPMEGYACILSVKLRPRDHNFHSAHPFKRNYHGTKTVGLLGVVSLFLLGEGYWFSVKKEEKSNTLTRKALLNNNLACKISGFRLQLCSDSDLYLCVSHVNAGSK